jgi:hypothetical protein
MGTTLAANGSLLSQGCCQGKFVCRAVKKITVQHDGIDSIRPQKYCQSVGCGKEKSPDGADSFIG